MSADDEHNEEVEEDEEFDDEEDDDEDDDDLDDYEDLGNIFYIQKDVLENVKKQLAKKDMKEDDLKKDLTTLFDVDYEELEDTVQLVPVDMTVFGEDLEEPEDFIKEKGAKAVAQLFVDAEKAVAELPEDERPDPMDAKTYKEGLLESGALLDSDEEEDDEEDDDEEDDEEDEDEEDGDADEPAAKKAKTA